jgi:ATPase subunit of ABC transporter with duplicated ATPase domains
VLQLLWVLVQRPNFLVLDEPSNDLDLQTLQALEEFLTEEYQGVLVVVSHDRRFMDKVRGVCYLCNTVCDCLTGPSQLLCFSLSMLTVLSFETLFGLVV